MTPPMQPDQPWQLQLKPAEWQQVLQQALGDIRKNPKDAEALQAVRDANEALNVYGDAEAAPPGERIQSGVEGGLAGLGAAAVDIPRGLYQTVRHPIQTLANIRQVPGQLAAGLTSDDPEQVARSVGNIGAFALPFAKTSKAAGAPTVGAVAGRAATKPLRAIGAVLERPLLRNQLLREQITRLQGRGAPPPATAVMDRALKQPRRPQPDPLNIATAIRRGTIEPTFGRSHRLRERPAPPPRTPKVGTRAPGGGRYAEPGPHQKAPPRVRVESPRAPSDLIQRQIELLTRELQNTPRSQWPAKLQTLQDLGVLTKQQVAEILAGT